MINVPLLTAIFSQKKWSTFCADSQALRKAARGLDLPCYRETAFDYFERARASPADGITLLLEGSG
jgi:hypothetical protein